MLGGALVVLIAGGVTGAMWSIVCSTLILFILSFYPLRFLFKKQIAQSPIPTKELVSYGFPAGLAILGLTAFISTDILLVKHFFSPENAGIYASLSLVAKIIFFLTASISTVMFPVVVQKRSKGEPYLSTFLIGIALVAIPSFLITVCYFLFPSFVILFIVKKSTVVSYSSHLGIFGVLMSLYSLVSLLTNFYLSLKKTAVAIPICIVAILQAALIWMYHGTFMDVILISLVLMLLLLAGLLLYYPNATKK
jgi:O-antigen/teichoic acid export membrane protein